MTRTPRTALCFRPPPHPPRHRPSGRFAPPAEGRTHAKPKAKAGQSRHHPQGQQTVPPAEQAMTTDANGQSIPLLENKAWVLMDYATGRLLASSNPDEPLPPASLTKMMTSYLVERGLKSGKVKSRTTRSP